MSAGQSGQQEAVRVARGVRGFSSAALRNARQAENLTPTQFAQELRVSTMTVLRWEGGESLPTAGHLATLAAVLGRDPADFVVQASAGLRRRRNLAGLSQREAAQLSGLDRSTISRLETGGSARPTVETVTALARVYGCTVEDIAHDLSSVKEAIELEVASRQAARRGRR